MINDDLLALLPALESWGARHTFTFLSFLGMANVYAMRVNLSVAIVAMVGGESKCQYSRTRIS